MARTRVRRRRLAALLLVAVVWVGGGAVPEAVGLGDGPAARATRTYVIRPGDTLWAIATAIEPDADPREVVQAMTEANDLDPGGLVPGQRIAITTAG